MIENRKKTDEKQVNSEKKKKIRESMQEIQCLDKIGNPDNKKSENRRFSKV